MSSATPVPASNGRNTAALLREVYQRLYDAYGPQHWWPGEGGPLEVCVGAILTQSCSWTNVERALEDLRAAGALSLHGLRDLPEPDLARLIRPCGYFNMKARKVKAFVTHVWERYDGDLARFLSKETNKLRTELLSVYGIGEETADDIVLYAAGKPSFVVDAYTRRILDRLGHQPEGQRYGDYQAVFHQHLPTETGLFNEYHALLVRLGKEACQKTTPRCGPCPVRVLCPTGQASAPPAPAASPGRTGTPQRRAVRRR